MGEAIEAFPTAPAALVLSVPLTFLLFSSFPPYRAAFLSLLISALVLPVGYGWQLPGITTLDKTTIPLLSAIAACLVTAPGEFRHLRLRGGTLAVLVALVLAPFLTAFTNSDAYSVNGVVLQGLTTWDGVALFREMAFSLVLPFLLGRTLVRNLSQLESLLRALAFALLIYSIPMLWEVRMSPQLHTTVYGYFPHSFMQQERGGGFRPVVFVGHGLPLAIITSFAAIASAVLWRRGRKIHNLPPAFVTFYLGALVVLCKTLSAMIYGVIGGLVAFFASAKTQCRVAVVTASIVLAYPSLRSSDLFPTSLLSDLSATASAERSESLTFRFKNEDLLLGHDRERWLFGWGGYGRDRVVNDEDKTVTDGLWIILFGQLGALGFLSVFGLMLLPIFRCPRAVRNMSSPSDRRLLASFAFLVSLNWADSLPNSLSGGVVMVFATGALSGVVERYQTPLKSRSKGKEPEGASSGNDQEADALGSAVRLR